MTNTISSIVDTATASVSSYGQARQPIADLKEALTQRDEEIKTVLSGYATSRGVGSDQIEALFVEAGLSEPAPEPEPEVTRQYVEGQGDGDRLSAIESTLARLVAFAERHGLR